MLHCYSASAVALRQGKPPKTKCSRDWSSRKMTGQRILEDEIRSSDMRRGVTWNCWRKAVGKGVHMNLIKQVP